MKLTVTQTDECKDQVKKALHDSKDLRIVFTKKDGTDREMFCTLNESKIPSDKQPKSEASNSTAVGSGNESAVRVFDTIKQEWRSFRWDSVKQAEVV